MVPRAEIMAACALFVQVVLFVLYLFILSSSHFPTVTPKALPAKQKHFGSCENAWGRKVDGDVYCENEAVVSEISGVNAKMLSTKIFVFLMLTCQLISNNKCSEIPMSAQYHTIMNALQKYFIAKVDTFFFTCISIPIYMNTESISRKCRGTLLPRSCPALVLVKTRNQP